MGLVLFFVLCCFILSYLFLPLLFSVFFHAPYKSHTGSSQSQLFLLSSLLMLELFQCKVWTGSDCLHWECRAAIKAGVHFLYEVCNNSSVFPLNLVTDSLVGKKLLQYYLFLCMYVGLSSHTAPCLEILAPCIHDATTLTKRFYVVNQTNS